MQAHASSLEGAFPESEQVIARSLSGSRKQESLSQERSVTADSNLESSVHSEPPPAAQAQTHDTPSPVFTTLDPPVSSPEVPSWTKAFLAPSSAAANASPILKTEAVRFATGALFASLYGLALGVREGGTSLIRHAVGVPAALLAVTALGVPALYIILALFNAPLAPPRIVSAASRASASTGLILAGLAPAAALFVVSSERAVSAVLIGALGLIAGGIVGVVRFLRELGSDMKSAPETTKVVTALAFCGFAVFATALALRVWWSLLPMFGGES